MCKCDFISYDELVEENKKRRAHLGLDNLKKIRIQAIIPNQDNFIIKIFNVGLQSEITYPLSTLLKAYMTYKDIYFTNITVSDFKDVFVYKSKSAREKAQRGTTSKQTKTTLLPVISKMFLDTEQLLKEMTVKQNSDRSEGITVVALAAMCMEEIRKGNGDKHILLQNDDEGNGLHTCFNGMREFDLDDPYEFKSGDCHDHNDLTKCVMIS